ncbi:MAG: (2Fe-2S)-binding protein [Caldisericaceae bacterium]
MSTKVNFTVNGTDKTVEIEGWEKLLDVLREYLNLTGAKRGCDDGTCGACTVIVNGEAVKSCMFPASKLEGANIVTIEGLSKEGTNIIQKSLIDVGAVQCGFCTPGIVAELTVLFTKVPEATEDQIKDALSKHLCRCTGYEAIMQGAKSAQKKLEGAKKAQELLNETRSENK